MKLVLPSGTSSYTTFIFVKDSTSTTGAGLTGLAYNSAGLTGYYIRKGQSSTTSVTLATATLGTWTSGGFVVVDGTNMPGVYELGIPNACLSGGTCILYLKGAANMVPVKIEIQIEPVPSNVTQYGGTGAQFINGYPVTNAFDRQAIASATNNTVTVSATMSNGANYVGHLMTITNATGLYDTVMCTGFSAPSTFTANRNWRTNPDNTSIVTFFFSDGVRVNSSGNVLVDLQSILGTVLTETVGGYITAGFKKLFDVATPVFTAASVNQTGDNYARLGAPAGASVSADIAAVHAKTTNLPAAPASTTNITAGTITTVTNLTNAGPDTSGTTTLLSRLTSARGGYLDNLNTGGVVATESNATSNTLAILAAIPGASTIATAVWAVATSGLTTAGTIGKLIVDGWGKFTGITYLARWLGSIVGKTADSTTLAEINATTAGANYDNTTMSLEKLSEASAGSGSGANAVTITVRDGSSVAIQNATVSAWSGSSLVGTSTTNASGVTSPALSLDNGTYTINITAGGFNGSSASLVVSGATAHTYTLTALTITPSDPPFVTGYLVTRVAGVATANVVVSIAMTKTATGEAGSAYLGSPITTVSDGTGVATFTNLSAGATYSIRLDAEGTEWSGEFVADDVTFEIPSVVG